MFYSIAADCLVVLHLGFICFVMAGGFLVLKWRWLAYIHIPAAIWGALIEFQGWGCPLTPLEQSLRQAGGQGGYTGGFIEHYVTRVVYPDFLGRDLQIVLGAIVIVLNIAVYSWVIMRLAKRQKLNKKPAD